jgi:hypothetical protein
MAVMLEKREGAAEHTVLGDDTLEAIGASKCAALGGWKALARYNWGTEEPAEILRALAETVGISTVDYARPESLANPEKIKLAPDPRLDKKLKIPKAWAKDALAPLKTHTIKVRPLLPATAVDIAKLDPWFVPKEEACVLEYKLEGAKAAADALTVDVFGSNYCECTDWGKGLGVYGSPTALAAEPIFTRDLSTEAKARKADNKLAAPWKGEATTTKGMLGRKTGAATQRHINVAFSPYTVQFRYAKAGEAEDAKARLLLLPFWPQWKDATPVTPTVTPTVAAGDITLAWTNAAAADSGILVIKDRSGQRVYAVALTAEQLKAGAQTAVWTKKYLFGALNTLGKAEYVDDTAASATTTVVTDTTTSTATATVVRRKDHTGRVISTTPLPDAYPPPTTTRTTSNSTTSGSAVPTGAATGMTVATTDTGYIAGAAATTAAVVTATPRVVDETTTTPYTSTKTVTTTSTRVVPAGGNTPYTYEVATVVRELVPEALKIKYEVKETARLERGLLLVTDGAGKLVFHRALIKADLTKAEHEFVWDGKYAATIKNSKTGDTAIPEDMPYRVQIQAHTPSHEAKGLALAVMHTEVRVYVHPESVLPSDRRHELTLGSSSLGLGLAPVVPDATLIPTAGTKFYQYKLWEYGYHPGPIDGASTTHFATSLVEFMRSVPKAGASGGVHERLKIEAGAANENADTLAAITGVRAADKRQPFGDPALVSSNNDRPDLSYVDASARIKDPAKELIVWVDDRHCYTGASGGDEPYDENGYGFLTGRPRAGDGGRPAPAADAAVAAAAQTFSMGLYRGGMALAGDDRTTKDADSTPRPWIPVQADLTLVGRANKLSERVAAPSDAVRESMRRSIGPLRIDWTFDELPPDHSSIAGYDANYIRSRSYVAWAVDQKKATHARPDTGRAAVYTNCPADDGGIRPSALPTYYAQAFGHAGSTDTGLAPWKGTAVAATESIATVVHEHLSAAQVDKTDLFEGRIGLAGTYFRPSIIAGDGYRLRAEVQFEAFTDYAFPNLATLKARYPVRPHAHSAAMRVWRRSSFRGTMRWGGRTPAHGGYVALVDEVRRLYRPAYVYFVHEGGSPRTFAVADILDPGKTADKDRFANVVANNLPTYAERAVAAMTLKADHVWAWSDSENFGWAHTYKAPSAKVPATSTTAEIPAYAGDGTPDAWVRAIAGNTWDRYRSALMLTLIKAVEKNGYLRGHLMVEFGHAQGYKIEMYRCPDGHETGYLRKEPTTTPGRLKTGARCERPACGKALSDGTDKPGFGGWCFLDAGGLNLGGAFLFTTESAARYPLLWAHEMGHHRHMEHAATAPGAVTALHDAQDNTHVGGWTAIDPKSAAEASRKRWDRRCAMSYADTWNPMETTYFCGKCILRSRGWKVTGLSGPGPGVGDP